MTSDRRKAEIDTLYAAGHAAALAGQGRNPAPYGYHDWHHWLEGYDAAKAEQRAQATVPLESVHDQLSALVGCSSPDGSAELGQVELLLEELGVLRAQASKPVPMLLACPACHAQHVDEPDPAMNWTNPPHRKHLCRQCGALWRPANILTTGVAVLP